MTDRLHRIEYLAMNLVQKLREMETPWMHYAAASGVEYTGPNFRQELFDLTEALKEKQ
jgi:hypothetical protein